MGVRNCREVGENLQKIVTRLMANDKLVNLLYYSDMDPLSHEPLTAEQKKEFIFNKLIRVVPRIGPKETAQSLIVMRVVRGTTLDENTEFRDIDIQFEIFVPLTEWMIKDTNLRPFAILGEIQESLNNKKINGLGRMVGGSFSLNYLTDEISVYEQDFHLISYD